MQKVLNNLINIKDIVIDQKSKYETNMIKCCNIFSTKIDELNSFFISFLL